MLQKSLPPAQVLRYCNLVRWFDHMQHTVDTTSVFSRVEFRKPGLPGPPTPPIQAAAKVVPSLGQVLSIAADLALRQHIALSRKSRAKLHRAGRVVSSLLKCPATACTEASAEAVLLQAVSVDSSVTDFPMGASRTGIQYV